jgi:hypothetical protein
MSDTLPETEITIPIDGTDRRFIFLNSYDKAEFVRAYKKMRKAELVENRKAAGASPEQIAVDLDAWDENQPDADHGWIKWLQDDDDAQILACRLSLKKTYPADVEKIVQSMRLTGGEMRVLVIKLFSGWVSFKQDEPVAPPNSSYGDGGPEPNPTLPGQTYGSPETSDSPLQKSA